MYAWLIVFIQFCIVQSLAAHEDVEEIATGLITPIRRGELKEVYRMKCTICKSVGCGTFKCECKKVGSLYSRNETEVVGTKAGPATSMSITYVLFSGFCDSDILYSIKKTQLLVYKNEAYRYSVTNVQLKIPEHSKSRFGCNTAFRTDEWFSVQTVTCLFDGRDITKELHSLFFQDGPISLVFGVHHLYIDNLFYDRETLGYCTTYGLNGTTIAVFIILAIVVIVVLRALCVYVKNQNAALKKAELESKSKKKKRKSPKLSTPSASSLATQPTHPPSIEVNNPPQVMVYSAIPVYSNPPTNAAPPYYVQNQPVVGVAQPSQPTIVQYSPPNPNNQSF